MQPRDNTPIFGAVARRYYDKGLSVIPLHYHDKRPIPNNWSQFHDHLPDPDTQESWIKHNSNCNVGLVLGQQSGICVVDIDIDNEDLIKVILDVLPESPWQRVGKKGMVLAFKWTGIPTFRIKDMAGKTLVEMLSTRTQVVLPPSVHPETKRAYTANRDLADVLDQLPELNPEVEALLRGALKEAGCELSVSGWTKVTEFVPAGARDVQMTRVAGHYAYGVVRGELPLLEAIERMRAWHATCMEHIAGDDIDIDKGIQNLVKFVVRDVIEKEKILPKGWDEGLTEEDKANLGLSFDDDHREWEFEELKDYLKDQFERHPEKGSLGRTVAVDYILGKVAKSPNLSSLEEDMLLKYMVDANGGILSLTALRKRIRELQGGGLKGTDHTEIAHAVINDMEQYGPLRFYGGKFWTWGGSHWVEKPENDILRTIADEYGNCPAARRNSDHKGVLKTIATLVPNTIKSQEVKGVNFANGFLMATGELVTHDPAYGMTYTLPFRYVKESAGKAFKFMEFLENCWGHSEDFQMKVDSLQEAMCATIFGMGPMLQRAILCHGAPKTGKSQLLKVVAALVPDTARATCPPEEWGDKFAPTTMHNKLINVCGELSDKRPIDGQRFKQIIDGEEMTGQFKGMQLFGFRPMCAHWFASNHLPRTDDTSQGFNRRWLVLTFDKPVTSEQRVLDYGELIVAEEREAIAAWAVEALPRLMERREYTLPTSHEETMEEVASMNNSVRFFILESGKVTLNGQRTSSPISEMKLHNAYWSFCLGAGAARPVGPRQFRQRMRELGIELGFKVRTERTENGTPVFVYDGITLAANQGL